MEIIYRGYLKTIMKNLDNQYVAKTLNEAGEYGSFHKCVELPCKTYAGQIVDDNFIFTNMFTSQNEFNKEDWVVGVPLDQVAVCKTPFDMTPYGFVKIGDKWVHPDRCSLTPLIFTNIESEPAEFHTPTSEEL